MAPEKTMPKTPASKAGRKKAGSLEDLDTQLQEASTDRTAEQTGSQASSSKRPAAEEAIPGDAEKRNKPARKERIHERSSSDNSDTNESDSDRSTDSSLSSSSSESEDDRTKRRSKAKGFILMRNNPLVTVGNRGTLRKTCRLLKSQASLMDKVDRIGKEAFVENYEEVRENLTFIRELIKSVKQDFPSHKKKKATLEDLNKLKQCLKGLIEVIDPSENAPQWGLHLLDWTEASELRKSIGKAAARKIRTAVKGQKRQHKVLFTKSPHAVSQTWKSKNARAPTSHSGNNRGGGRKQHDNRPKQAKHPLGKKTSGGKNPHN